MRPHRIIVVIDELNLHGFDPRTRHAIGDAFEHELARLFATPGPTQFQGAQIERLATPAIAVAAGTGAPALGARLAERVHGQVAAARPAAPPGRS